MLAVQKAIGDLHWRLIAVDTPHGIVRAKTSASMRSWGEDVQIQIMPAAGYSRMTAIFEPAAQAFDWGRSRDSLQLFIHQLQDLLPGKLT